MSADWQVFAATFGVLWLAVLTYGWFELLAYLSRPRGDR